MKAVLLKDDLWEVVEDKVEDRPPALTDASSTEDKAANRAWTRRQNKALAVIYLHVGDRQQALIRSFVTPKDAWEALMKQYAKPSLTRRLMLRSQFHSHSMSEGGSVLDHVNSIRTLAEQLAAINDPVDEDLMVIQLLNGLPSSWGSLIVALDASGQVQGNESGVTQEEGDQEAAALPALSFAKVSEALLREEERRLATSSSSHEAVFKARAGTGERDRKGKWAESLSSGRGTATTAKSRVIGLESAARKLLIGLQEDFQGELRVPVAENPLSWLKFTLARLRFRPAHG